MATKNSEADKWESHMGKKPGAKNQGRNTEIHRPEKKKPIEGKKVETHGKKTATGKTVSVKEKNAERRQATAKDKKHEAEPSAKGTQKAQATAQTHPGKESRGTAEAAKEVPLEEKVRDLGILKHPLVTEKSVGMIEDSNKLTFVVDSKATKYDVKQAIQGLYKVKVRRVNMLRDMKARKRAIVTLDKSAKAGDLATKLGVI
ncbi:MAG: 50S ribosomal protein L23 [Candidatus Diapherotrites archaeon]|uniref:Large ribosomal subunit protein uL23 n=1 Tax=Candidatus Iainarchaeum sp. TaxID=3101447 RepID=A0A8T3YHV9_9ARCH|nr:50S ribosomal protein L23 [Candidatus Diapherotrites archaeon]